LIQDERKNNDILKLLLIIQNEQIILIVLE